jgi:hypothetical protein
VFPELYSQRMEEELAREDPDARFFKISYTLNLLPRVDKDHFDGNMMDIFGSTEQLEVFKTKVVQDIIRFKWQSYGQYVHQTAASFHIVYVVTFLIHLERTYLSRIETISLPIIIIMTVCNTFAFLYDGR